MLVFTCYNSIAFVVGVLFSLFLSTNAAQWLSMLLGDLCVVVLVMAIACILDTAC